MQEILKHWAKSSWWNLFQGYSPQFMAKLDIHDGSNLYVLTINFKFESSSINFDSILSFIG